MLEGDILDNKFKQPIIGFKFSEVIIIVLITSIFSVFAGISFGKVKYSNTTVKSIDKIESNEALLEFNEQYKYIISNYYDKTQIDEEDLLATALEGIITKLGIEDPYSTYMDDKEYNNLNISLSGSYEGLGVTITKLASDDYIYIIGILDNSPASKAGLKVGDYIYSIDGKKTDKMSTSEFTEYVKNSKSSTYKLIIDREKKKIDINISKKKIEISSVTSEIIEKDKHKIGYISLSIFATNTYTQFKDALNKLQKAKVDGVIIDLRDNTGGHLAQAKKIVSMFVDKEKVVYQLEKEDNVVKYYSTGKKDFELPIVFITNNSTASASEVTILGIKENLEKVLIVGEKTYGKGTVQEMITLTNGDKYKITTKKWLSPKGNWVNKTNGIEPDVKVKLSDKYLTNPTKENDNQLNVAIDKLINLAK